jgi:NAD(P)-dependent dehydrogenase (short-subunit alcohol dehydrogenase family)
LIEFGNTEVSGVISAKGKRLTREGFMADKRIIAITGATGAQGGGLARAILADPTDGFVVRAVTRNVDSEKAQALAQAGAEVVAANMTTSTA